VDQVLHVFGVMIEQNRSDVKLARGEVTGEVTASVLARNLFALYFLRLVIWLGWKAAAPEASKPSLRQMVETRLFGLRSVPKAAPSRRGKTRQTQKRSAA